MHILIKPCKTLSGISCSLAYIGSCLGVSFVFNMQLCGPHYQSFPTLQWTTYIQNTLNLCSQIHNIHIISSPSPPFSLSKSFKHSHINRHIALPAFPLLPSHSLSSLIINPIILLLKFQLLPFFCPSKGFKFNSQEILVSPQLSPNSIAAALHLDSSLLWFSLKPWLKESHERIGLLFCWFWFD